jgi:hypothetical protein
MVKIIPELASRIVQMDLFHYLKFTYASFNVQSDILLICQLNSAWLPALILIMEIHQLVHVYLNARLISYYMQIIQVVLV